MSVDNLGQLDGFKFKSSRGNVGTIVSLFTGENCDAIRVEWNLEPNRNDKAELERFIDSQLPGRIELTRSDGIRNEAKNLEVWMRGRRP